MSLPLCYVDAPGWPDTITVKVALDYDGTYGSGDNKAGTTTTGTATFTWQRETLADRMTALGGRPKFPVGDIGEELDPVPSGGGPRPTVRVAKGKFLALAGAAGKMPGWVVYFGDQDPVKNAFTNTTYVPAVHGQPPPAGPGDVPAHTTTSQSDANPATLGANCSLIAPGRPLFLAASASPIVYAGGVGEIGMDGVLAILTTPSQAETQDGVPIQVTLVQPGQAATATAAAVGPVYRVTIPNECDLNTNLGGIYPGDYAYVYIDGEKFPAPTPPSQFTGLYDLSQLGGGYYRSSNVYDVQLSYGQTMSAGSIGGYQGFDPKPSQVFVSASGDFSFDLDNPFPMTGQSFTRQPSDAADGQPSDGLTVTVQF